MTPSQRRQLLNTWHTHHEAIEALFADLSQPLGCLAETPLFETVWQCFEAYTKTVEELVGDDYDTLTWFYLENDMGRKGMEAGYRDDMRPIKTLDDLIWLIDLECGDEQNAE